MKTSNRQMQGGSSGMHPERRITLDSIRVDVLPPHPLSVKIYGKPKPTEELLRSIEEVGLLQPLIVNNYEDGSFQLLVGNTRAEAWRVLLKQKKITTNWIPCRFVKLSPLEAEKLVIESNRQRVKTREMEGREFIELERIEEALAKERQRILNNKETASGQTAGSARKGEAAALAAATLGMGANTAKKLKAVVEAADKGDTKAQIALSAVNAGNLSVSGAYQTVAKPKHPEKISAGVSEARELAKLFKNGEVTRSKRDGLFHVTIRDVTSEQVRKLAKVV
jgi:ParB-like chromosome segregation protein Spo0J